MVTIAICDDDAILTAHLQQQVKDAFLENGVATRIEVFGIAHDFLNALQEVYYDVIFLDIIIGQVNGIELGHTLRREFHNSSSLIVFITSYEHYQFSDESYLATPMAFLIKPIDYSKIRTITEEICKRRDNKETDPDIFTYSFGTYNHSVILSEIYYFRSDLRTKYVVLKDKTLPLNCSMAEIIKKVEGKDFIFVNRSYLVNANHIIHYTKTEITMRDDVIIPFSTRKQKQAMDEIIDFIERRNAECTPLLI